MGERKHKKLGWLQKSRTESLCWEIERDGYDEASLGSIVLAIDF